LAKTDKKPLVGFFPLTYNLAEVGRAILVARQYVKKGGKAVFFSHGGKYEHLIKDFGYDIVRVPPFYNENIVKDIVSINRGEKRGIPYSESFLRKAVKEEVKAFNKTKIKMVVSFVNYPCSISARSVGIPLIYVTPAPGRFHYKIHDGFENSLTRLIPQFLKVPVYNYLFYSSKKYLKPFNIVANEYGLNSFKSTHEVIDGDFKIGTNFLEFIDIIPNQLELPKKNYVGIILLNSIFSQKFNDKEAKIIDKKIQKHLKRQGKSILLTMGSSGDKKFFLDIINTLNKTEYNVIAVYAKILKKDELPELNDNILLFDFVPAIQDIHKKVDLTIMHGGQGTVYSAAYAGKPIIGFPMNFEQHLNLEKMVGHNVGFLLSRRYFKEKNLLNTISKVFNNYDYYLKNAKALTKKLPPPAGDKKAADKIIELIEKYQEEKTDEP